MAADAGRPKFSPLNLITMAEVRALSFTVDFSVALLIVRIFLIVYARMQGPPSDASTGFPAGWRAEAEANRATAIADLPWAFLFQ